MVDRMVALSIAIVELIEEDKKDEEKEDKEVDAEEDSSIEDLAP